MHAAALNFEQTDNQKMVAQMAKDFSEKHIRPYVMEWDEAQIFPKETLQEMGKLGLLGVLVPEEYGGAGLGYFEYITAIIEISKVCSSVGLSMAAHNSLCTGHICNSETKSKRKSGCLNWQLVIGLAHGV